MPTNGDLKRWFPDAPVDKEGGDFARLDGAGKIPSSVLPSYVDDVVEGYFHDGDFYKTRTGEGTAQDPYVYSDLITPEGDKIYVDIPTSTSYRRGSTSYIAIGGGSEKIIVEGTMQTSTLPAMTVPALTKEQIEKIHTLISQGKYVMVDDGNGQYVVSESDNLLEEIRFTYMGMYLGYYVEGDNVVATYAYVGALGTNDGTNWTDLTIGGVTKALGGGGEKLYLHHIYLWVRFAASASGSLPRIEAHFLITSPTATPYTIVKSKYESYMDYGKKVVRKLRDIGALRSSDSRIPVVFNTYDEASFTEGIPLAYSLNEYANKTYVDVIKTDGTMDVIEGYLMSNDGFVMSDTVTELL